MQGFNVTESGGGSYRPLAILRWVMVVIFVSFGMQKFTLQSAQGSGSLEPLASFVTNPAGAAIVNALGPIRQIVQGNAEGARRYLVIAPGSMAELGKPVQVQVP